MLKEELGLTLRRDLMPSFSIQHSTFSIPPSAFAIRHSAFSIQHSRLT